MSVVFIAEAGVNHNGDLDLALKLVDVARAAGADAVKFQTFKSGAISTPEAPMAEYQKARDGAASQAEMLKRLELPDADFARIADHCRAVGIEFMSSPFDIDSARMLAGIGMKRFKLASGEITNAPFVKGVARLAAEAGGEVILSTGMSTLDEVAEAVGWIAENGDPGLTILHCVSNYPAPAKDANLRAMETLAEAFGKPVGWSDHTLGDAVSLAAVARGAMVIEKHFTLDKAMPGPDHAMSLSPEELTGLIAGVRAVEASLGDGIKRPVEAEREIMVVARRSLYAARDIAAGAVIAAEDLIALRPGDGISAARHDAVVGRTAASDIAAGTKLDLFHFA
ncbi:N-acetylneuraminate synthase [Brevundimonas staleyi]|uniref:N-acetylneuraminate synthase n=1 Tax=Brevundimonas staleyi TaxID=74326 RepID=A0ABW0FTG0_9CAUL